jgi:hypothetical protein
LTKDAPVTTFFGLTHENGNTNNFLSISQLGTDLLLTYFANGMIMSNKTIAFDAIMHRWWRLREASGTTYFETAPDGVSWTVRHSVSTPSFADSMWIYFGAGAFKDAAPGGGAIFDNVNIVP